MRFGLRKPLGTGLLLAAAGLVLFARAPVGGSFIVDVLPSMILLGFGAGMAFNPVLLAAMSDVAPEESGLASGIVNTARMVGATFGIAALGAIYAAHLNGSAPQGMLAGLRWAFLGGAIGELSGNPVLSLFLNMLLSLLVARTLNAGATFTRNAPRQ